MYSIYKNNYIKYISILLILTLVLSSCGKGGGNVVNRETEKPTGATTTSDGLTTGGTETPDAGTITTDTGIPPGTVTTDPPVTEKTGIMGSIKGWVKSTQESITEHPVVATVIGAAAIGAGAVAVLASPISANWIMQKEAEEVTKMLRKYKRTIQDLEKQRDNTIKESLDKRDAQITKLDNQLRINKEEIRNNRVFTKNDRKAAIGNARKDWKTERDKEESDHEARKKEANKKYLEDKEKVEKELNEKLIKLKERQEKRSKLIKWIQGRFFKNTLNILNNLNLQNYGHGKDAVAIHQAILGLVSTLNINNNNDDEEDDEEEKEKEKEEEKEKEKEEEKEDDEEEDEKEKEKAETADFSAGSLFDSDIIQGGGWMFNTQYVEGLGKKHF
jgi:hypothetical protein